MLTESGKKRKISRLAWEMIGILCLCLAIALFSFGFLYYTSLSLADVYLERIRYTMTEREQVMLQLWSRGLCLLGAVVIYVALFLFFSGQKIGYLLRIIQGIGALQEEQAEAPIPEEGEDELTQLARSINYLSQSQQRLLQKEREIQQKKEQMTRSLSHDIRTPLTSILSYADYLLAGGQELSREQAAEALGIIQHKAQQIKELTDRFLESRKLEWMPDGRLLLMQLAEEWEEDLEGFSCQMDWAQCGEFSGYFDLAELRRIFDNLASNIRKYADPSRDIQLSVRTQDGFLTLEQENLARRTSAPETESRQIGLESIRQISQSYQGQTQVQWEGETFRISVALKINSSLPAAPCQDGASGEPNR